MTWPRASKHYTPEGQLVQRSGGKRSRITGGFAGNILTTNGAGVLSWSAAPGGGLTSVNTDGTTITSDSAPAALSCIAAPKLLTARNIDVAGSSGTTLGSIVPLSFDKTAATISALKLQYSTQERTRRGARKSKSNVERPAPAVDKPVDDGEQLTRISLAVD